MPLFLLSWRLAGRGEGGVLVVGRRRALPVAEQDPGDMAFARDRCGVLAVECTGASCGGCFSTSEKTARLRPLQHHRLTGVRLGHEETERLSMTEDDASGATVHEWRSGSWDDNSGQAGFSPGGSSYPATATPPGYRPAVPPTNAGWAVAASVLFFPVAFSAWTAALNVTRLWVMDDFYGAQAASDKAKRLGKIALGIGVTIFVLYFAFIIITIVAVGVSTAPTRTR